MNNLNRSTSTHWAIVVADDHDADSGNASYNAGGSVPVQYRPLFGRRTLFQDALQRAMRVAPASRIMVTALDTCRPHWEPALWFIKPEHRFVSIDPGMSWLTTAAAILSIAQQSPDSVVTLLPGRCFVSHEALLAEALDQAIAVLPHVPEAVVSLGMQDPDGGTDEDYLVPRKGETGLLMPLLGVARRPVPWIAQHLRAGGAVVASRITCSYAQTLAAHISLVWPGLTATLLESIVIDASRREDGGIRTAIPSGTPRAMLRSRQWYPPTLPQRALRVRSCGWSGLRTARAVAQIDPFLTPSPLDLSIAS